MKTERYIELIENDSLKLTKKEVKDGYFWCDDCDGEIGHKDKSCCKIVWKITNEKCNKNK